VGRGTNIYREREREIHSFLFGIYNDGVGIRISTDAKEVRITCAGVRIRKRNVPYKFGKGGWGGGDVLFFRRFSLELLQWYDKLHCLCVCVCVCVTLSMSSIIFKQGTTIFLSTLIYVRSVRATET
jgi:hypothetical protein